MTSQGVALGVSISIRKRNLSKTDTRSLLALMESDRQQDHYQAGSLDASKSAQSRKLSVARQACQARQTFSRGS